MAITGVHYRLLKEHAPLFKRGGALLEIGEANWYGDVSPMTIWEGISEPAFRPHHKAALIGQSNADSFGFAKFAYEILFSPSVMHAVDLHGSDRPETFQQDLNRPLELSQLYDVVINHGTCEHIFNIAMVFKSMHDATTPDGYMIHDVPFTGWVDHGFYCLQPGLFFDLAAANEYELVSISITHIESQKIIRLESREHLHSLKEIPNNSMLFVVLKKPAVQKPFRIPLQGYYAGALSESGQKAWRENR